MQGRNPSTAIPGPDQKRKQRLRMLRNCTIVVLVVVLIVLAVNLVRYFTRSRSIGVYSLPCFAHQDVTVFRDGVVYYDGESIHCVGATGTVLWSYPVGSGASFSVSDKYLIAWSGTQLFIVNENGRPTYNEPMTSEIQFARIGNTRAVIVLGDEINPEVMMVDLNGQLLDSEKGVFEGKMLLDCGFFGTGEEYCWTLSADVYSPALATYLHTFQVNKMNTGNVNLGDHLVYKVFYANSKLYVFDTQQLTTYDYRGVQDTACHACHGRTKRTEVLYHDGGTIYVYLCYGMHWMLNIVTGHVDEPQAVLIRACADGANGPGKLTRRLQIDKAFNDGDITTCPELWIEDDGRHFALETDTRVGIGYAAPEDQARLWRWKCGAQEGCT